MPDGRGNIGRESSVLYRMPTRNDSSEQNLGQLYDAVPLYAKRGDVEFYLARAKEIGGPVLELGCGTGRILLPTARAGIAITGIERSSEMLDQCRAMLSAEPAEVQKRVSIHSNDVRHFSLDSSFVLVTAPFRVMQLLPEIDDQLACLECVHRHLSPGGRFVFDVFNPNFRALVTDRSEEAEDTPHTAMPDGRVMRRTRRVSVVNWIDQVSDIELIYYVSDSPDSPAERHVQSLRMRWFGRDELYHLLARAGFTVETIDGDFEGGSLHDESPEIVVTAVQV